MIYTIILILVLIFSLMMLVVMSSIVWGLIVTGGVPFISTNKKDFQSILEAVDCQPKEVVYDLGCGKASFLVYAAKNFDVKGVGYELSLWPYLWAKFNVWKSGLDIKIYRKNFHSADLSQANVVFCYLFPEVMNKLESKFDRELKSGSRVVSYAFKLSNKQPDKDIVTNDDNVELGRIYVYKY